jgi:hypothetical protein
MPNRTRKVGRPDPVRGPSVPPTAAAKDSLVQSRFEPLESWKIRLSCFALVFALSLIVYLKTLAPTVTLVDSGELIVAARWLGVAHPPGFPLYVLLAHLSTLLPFGNVAERVNFASALFAALASGLAALLVAEAMITKPPQDRKRVPGRKDKHRPGAAKGSEQGYNRLPVILKAGAPILAGLALAWSRTLWAYATITEVYTLNTLLLVAIFLLMIIWRRGIYAARATQPAAAAPSGTSSAIPPPLLGRLGPDAALYIAAFIFGLALGVHHVTVGLTLPALGAFVLATEGWSFFKSLRLLRAAIISFAGLAIYLYLPLAASRSPVLNWGDPVTLRRMWDHISGKQYRVFLKFAGDQIGRLFEEFLRIADREFGPPLLPFLFLLSFLGFVALWRKRESALFLLLSLTVVADLAYGLSYEIAEDKDAYYLPAFIAISLAAGFGAGWLINVVYGLPSLRRGTPALGLSLVILAAPVLVELRGNFAYNNRSQFYIGHDYIDNILATVEQGGMLMTQDWQVYSPLMYVREVERHRTDVVAIDAQLLRRLWYYDYLRKEYPEMMAQTRPQVDAFLDDLQAWDRDPDLYDRDSNLNKRINSRFTDMMLAFVKYQMAHTGVYMTEDLALNFGGDVTDFTKSLGSQYQFVPQGLVFQLEPDHAFHMPSNPSLSVRGLFDGTIAFDPDDVVEQKVAPAYLNMLVNKGRYLAAYGQRDLSIDAYREALRLRPDYPPAAKPLAEAERGSGK